MRSAAPSTGALRRIALPAAGLTLLASGLGFFHECVRLLTGRDYVAAALVAALGLALLRVAIELLRLALEAPS